MLVACSLASFPHAAKLNLNGFKIQTNGEAGGRIKTDGKHCSLVSSENERYEKRIFKISAVLNKASNFSTEKHEISSLCSRGCSPSMMRMMMMIG